MIRNAEGESGFSIMEVMVALVILSLVGLASTKNSMMSMVSFKRSLRNSFAMQLAVEKLEELGSINPTNLDASDNTTESSVALDSVTFTRSVVVTVNADGSRTVAVSVQANDTELGGAYEVENTYPLWGNT